METVKYIKEAAVLSGFEIYDEDEYIRILNYQLEHGQFEFLECENKTIGYFGWLTNMTHQGLGVWINNMFVIPEYKKNFNIFDMCKFFKQKYPNIYKLEWHSQRRDKTQTLILKGRKI